MITLFVGAGHVIVEHRWGMLQFYWMKDGRLQRAPANGQTPRSSRRFSDTDPSPIAAWRFGDHVLVDDLDGFEWLRLP